MKAEHILHMAYPERSEFSEVEIRTAEAILSVLNISDRAGSLPTEFVPIGGTAVVGGIRYVCVERPRNLEVCMACSGCDFNKRGRKCLFSNLQCSSFDREDRKSVWFVEG